MRLLDALRLCLTDVVSIVGGGGKTTLMFRLADEIVAAGGQVITTTTTRIFASQTDLAPFHLSLNDPDRLPPEFPALLATHSHILVTGPIQQEYGKAFGISTNIVDEMQTLVGNQGSAIVVEADGSRMLSLKAPAGHEPAIPDCTKVVIAVAGADILGESLRSEYVHRPEIAAELVEAQYGDPVTPDLVARLLLHPHGGRKGVPTASRWIPLINKIESKADIAPVRETAQSLLTGGADEVLLGAVATDCPVRERWGRVSAIVLAAGGSTRMAGAGEIKQLLPWGSGTLLSHAVDVALASVVSDVVAVVGCEAKRVEGVLDARRVNVVENVRWLTGQSSSIRAGLETLQAGTKAVLFLLVDQPCVGPEVIDALVDEYQRTGAPLVAPRVNGRRANPVLFDHSTWPELQSLKGDIGGRALFEIYGDRVAWVDWSEEIVAEINSPQDYSRLRRLGKN